MVKPASDRRRALLFASPVVAAAALAAALVGVSIFAASSLRARDAAVRDGLLARAGHELEARLRNDGPEGRRRPSRNSSAANAALVRGVEVVSFAGVAAHAGETEGAPVEMPAMLGPAWRPAGAGPGTGAGPGPGYGPGRGPFTLRFFPARGAASSGGLALALVLGSVVAGAGLVVLSLAAARGLAERERRERLEAERERLDAVALTGAGLAHRVRNPLAAIKGTAQLMADGSGQQVAERSRRIVEASARIEDLVSQILRFARPVEPQPQSVDLVALAREAAERAGIAVTVSGPPAVGAFADGGHAADVLDELLANARAHDPGASLRDRRRESRRHRLGRGAGPRHGPLGGSGARIRPLRHEPARRYRARPSDGEGARPREWRRGDARGSRGRRLRGAAHPPRERA